jgi:hypothetical protein
VHSTHINITIADMYEAGLGDEQVELLVTVDTGRITDPSLIISSETADKAVSLFGCELVEALVRD